MKIVEFAPAASPTPDQQVDALEKGLGRAMQWAMAGRLDDAILLDACLKDKLFEAKSYRGDWLWELMRAVHAEDRFRTAIRDALDALPEADAMQLCQIAFHYADQGDGKFRARLYEIVETRRFAEMRYLGEEEIIRLDGEEAFLFAVRLRERELENRAWEWDDAALVNHAIERLGEDCVEHLLEAAALESVQRFQKGWLCEKSEQRLLENPRVACEREVAPLSANDIISIAESPSADSLHMLRRWGRRAGDHDLNAVFERLLSAREPKTIANYLDVFGKRKLPRIVPEVISLTQHDDPGVRRRSFSVLGNNSHPLVRELAERELEKGLPNCAALALFVKNYRDGDEQRIVDMAGLPEDPCERHWFLMDAVKILEENPTADCSRLGLAACVLNPCSSCRYFAVRLLRGRHAAPDWLMEECRHDAEPDTRKLFAETEDLHHG